MTASVSTGWRRFGSSLLSTVVPEAWPPLPQHGADAAAGAEGRWTVRPNVVITSRPSTAPIQEVAQQVLAESAGIRLPVQLLAADVWPSAGAPGRRIEFVYETPDAAVLVTVWVFATGRHRVELTATRDLMDAVRLDAVVAAIGSRIAVHEPDGDITAQVLGDSSTEPLEALPADAAPALERTGWTLSAAERELLFASRGRGLQAGRARSAEGAALREAGLLTRFGGTTPEAELLLRCVDGVRTLVWRRDSDGIAARMHWELGDAVLVDRWEAPSADALARAPHRIEGLDESRGSAELLRWYGIHPGWAYSDPEPVPLRSEDVDRRVLEGPTEPPTELGPQLRRSWMAAPWTEFTATFGRSGRTWRTIRAGASGWYQVVPDEADDRVRLLPLPTANLVLGLLSGGAA